jgi:signal transduction histidine kinase
MLGVHARLSRRQPKVINFERNFAILSVLCILVISSSSAIILLRFLTTQILERDSVVAMQFIQSIAEIEQENSDSDFLSPAARSEPGVVGLFLHIAHAPDVIRATVYALDQTVVWSTDPNLIGQRFDDNEELRQALAGELVVELVDRKSSHKDEHAYLPNDVTAFVEYYVPIRSVTHDEVVGVAEIYRAPSVLLNTIAQGRWLVWGMAAVSGLFLFGTLFWIVHRTSGVLRSQQERLVESETLGAIGEMASAVAHGIRNPLASIRSSAELSLELDDPDASKEAAQDIIDEADRIENWILELIHYAHPEYEEFDRINLSDLVLHCLDSFSQTVERQGVHLTLNVQDSVLPIQGDSALLEQVVNNLISNALEAMPNGGSLTVGVGMTSRGDAVEVAVDDTGQGIPEEQLDQVFKPFVTSKKGGFGLGLLLVKRIVERHSGSVALSSQKGRGTSVTLRFPAMAGP